MKAHQNELFPTPDELAHKAAHFRGSKEMAVFGGKMITDIIYDSMLENNKNGSSHLGDRTKYIGSSDYCERSAYLRRVQPVTPNIETLMRFERGHHFENILAKALDFKQIQHTREHEFTHPEKPYVKAHCDFTMTKETAKKITVGIVECKDVDGIPGALYMGWEHQLTQQAGLAYLEFGKGHGKQVEIKTILLAKDAGSGGIRVFNNHPYYESEFLRIMSSADRVWAALKNPREAEDLYTRAGTLCAYCDYLLHCPAFLSETGLDLSPIADIVAEYNDNQRLEKEAEKTKKQAARKIEKFMGQHREASVACSHANSHVKMIHVSGREVTDYQALEEFLLEFAPSIVHRFRTKTSGYSYPRVTNKKVAA